MYMLFGFRVSCSSVVLRCLSGVYWRVRCPCGLCLCWLLVLLALTNVCVVHVVCLSAHVYVFFSLFYSGIIPVVSCALVSGCFFSGFIVISLCLWYVLCCLSGVCVVVRCLCYGSFSCLFSSFLAVSCYFPMCCGAFYGSVPFFLFAMCIYIRLCFWLLVCVLPVLCRILFCDMIVISLYVYVCIAVCIAVFLYFLFVVVVRLYYVFVFVFDVLVSVSGFCWFSCLLMCLACGFCSCVYGYCICCVSFCFIVVCFHLSFPLVNV